MIQNHTELSIETMVSLPFSLIKYYKPKVVLKCLKLTRPSSRDLFS